MREISLHLLDIAENSVAAGARNISISMKEDLLHDILEASVTDDGKGMTAEQAARVLDPFVTSRTTRKVGLGLPLLKAAAEACQGGLELFSEPGKGTRVVVNFQHSHIDRMPVGDLPGTILSLVIAYPSIHWVFNYLMVLPGGKGSEFCFDDSLIKETLDGVSLTEPDILRFLREMLEEGVASVRNGWEEKGFIQDTVLA
ncbi:MAG: ATP-binding protein [Chloroflexi bacterium]|nr:MAG: ATP-binding protein [Chloroflexota bacterium]